MKQIASIGSTRALSCLAAIVVLYGCPLVPPADPSRIGYNGDVDSESDSDGSLKVAASVVISGEGGVLQLGQTRQLSVEVHYTDGTSSANPRDVSWNTSHNGVITVTSDGVATAVGVGSASVRALANGATSEAVVFTTVPSGVKLDCDATTLFASGDATSCVLRGKTQSGDLAGAAIEAGLWTLTSANPAVVAVSGKSVSAPAGADGTTTLTATYTTQGGATLTDNLQVEAVYVTSISVSGGGTLIAGNSAEVTATLQRPGGGEVPAAASEIVRWQSSGAIAPSPTKGATVSALATGVGSGTIWAIAGATQSNVVAFTANPVSVRIEPGGPINLNQGQEQSFALIAVGAGGTDVGTFENATFNWEVTGNLSLDAAMPQYAVVSAQGGGAATLSATLHGVASNVVSFTLNALSPNPVFGGVTAANLGEAPDQVVLYWSHASDPQSPSSAIVYDVYKTDDGSLTFTAGELHTTTTAGATSAVIDGLARGKTWTFGVRARDPQGNTDNNTVTRSIYLPLANPPRADTILYVSGTTGEVLYANASLPTQVYELGSVKVSGASVVELTGPRFLYNAVGASVVVGIGQLGGNQQSVYKRTDAGSFVALRTVAVNTGSRGVTTPGSATAFGLTAPRDNLIAFTESGASSATVDLWVMTSDGATPRRLLTDVTRAVPTSDGKIAVVWYDNLYVVTPPTSLGDAGSYPTITPVTVNGGHTGELIFGRRDGGAHTLVAFTPSAGTVDVEVYDITDLASVDVDVASFTGGVATMTGGFVLSTPAGDLTGDLIVQVQSTASEHHLYAIDIEAGIATNLTPGGGLGKATVDTTRL